MKKTITTILIAVAAILSSEIYAQTAPAYAIKNVMIHNSDGTVIQSGAIVWRNGVIESIGSNVSIPFDAFTIDAGDSLHMYPGFIDGLGQWGAPAPKRPENAPDPGNPTYERAGIQPDRKPHQLIGKDSKDYKTAMQAGFTVAAITLQGRMLPGQVDVFQLHEENSVRGLYRPMIAQSARIQRAQGVYPGTLMGVMSRFRQLMYDAQALKDHMAYYTQNTELPAPNRDEVLESLFPVMEKKAPLYFEADSREDIDRIFTLQDEFGFNTVLVSGKEAWKVAPELKKRNISVLASLELPEAPKWYAAQNSGKDDKKKEEPETKEPTEEEKIYREKQLQAYKEALHNVKKLMEAGVKVGFASNGIKPADLKKSVAALLKENVVTENELLQLITKNTADILGINTAFGALQKGKVASFAIYSKPFTDSKAKVTHVVSNGEIHEF